MYQADTGPITVRVRPVFLREHSRGGRFVWAYEVQIENHGDQWVRLVGRCWDIEDAHGKVQEVRGEGVVGVQPKIEPGQNYRYSSFTALGTDHGWMGGEYQMEDGEGNTFWVKIPTFVLSYPCRLVPVSAEAENRPS